MSSAPQTSAEQARRRPLVQYEIVKSQGVFQVLESAAGSKPSHHLVEKPRHYGWGQTLDLARQRIPSGYKRLDRRRDDRADVVEVWV